MTFPQTNQSRINHHQSFSYSQNRHWTNQSCSYSHNSKLFADQKTVFSNVRLDFSVSTHRKLWDESREQARGVIAIWIDVDIQALITDIIKYLKWNNREAF